MPHKTPSDDDTGNNNAMTEPRQHPPASEALPSEDMNWIQGGPDSPGTGPSSRNIRGDNQAMEGLALSPLLQPESRQPMLARRNANLSSLTTPGNLGPGDINSTVRRQPHGLEESPEMDLQERKRKRTESFASHQLTTPSLPPINPPSIPSSVPPSQDSQDNQYTPWKEFIAQGNKKRLEKVSNLDISKAREAELKAERATIVARMQRLDLDIGEEQQTQETLRKEILEMERERSMMSQMLM